MPAEVLLAPLSCALWWVPWNQLEHPLEPTLSRTGRPWPLLAEAALWVPSWEPFTSLFSIFLIFIY